MKKYIWLISAAFAATTLASYAQGSLTPPGSPAATMKTLDQIEPRIDVKKAAGTTGYEHVITKPGSYYLSDHVEVTLPNGIYIDSEDVTLDLNGYTVSRFSGSGGFGIFINGGKDRIVVRNGNVVGFWTGIYCNPSPFASSCLLEKLAVSECTTAGIYAGTSARIVDCRAHGNSGNGIQTGEGAVLTGCTAENNQGYYGIQAGAGSNLSGCTAVGNQGAYGISVGGGSTLSDCSAKGNQCSYAIHAQQGSTLANCTAVGNQGIHAFYVFNGARMSGCVAVDNEANGIYTSSGASLENCVVRNNDSLYGIRAGNGSRLSGCTVDSNTARYGIYAFSGTSLHGCSAYYNTGTGTDSYGIWADIGSTVEGCNAFFNTNTNSPGNYMQGTGIYVRTGGTARNCTASQNRGDGIRLESNCLAEGNMCHKNGYTGDGAGIHATGYLNRISGNSATLNDRGFDVDSTRNIIVRNSVGDNGTNWDIVSGNICLVVQAVTAGSINGNTGGTSPGSTDPNANYTY